MHLACLQVKENTCMQPQTFTVLPQSCANTCAAHGQLLPLAALFKATWVSQNQDLKFCKNTCTGMKREILGPTEELHVLRLPQAENRPYLSSVNICLSHVSAISQASQLGPSFFFFFFFFCFYFETEAERVRKCDCSFSLPSMHTHFFIKIVLKKQ